MKPGTWIVTVVAACAAAGLTAAFIWLNMPMRLYMTTIFQSDTTARMSG